MILLIPLLNYNSCACQSLLPDRDNPPDYRDRAFQGASSLYPLPPKKATCSDYKVELLVYRQWDLPLPKGVPSNKKHLPLLF